MVLKRWAVIIWAILLLTAQVWASTKEMRPMETLKGPFNQIIDILNDPSYKSAEDRTVQRDKIWEIARPVFNFNEISRRAVGKPWGTFTSEEKNRFINVFSKFLGSTYIDKIQGEYSDEQIDFDKELVKGSKALVRTRLRRRTLEIPIDYRMHHVNGSWKIYDILVENGVSLVKNYRVQFTSILKDKTPAQLIERLEKKLAEQKTSTSKQK
ncbi:MAG: ABC transporter substrate-binding protein [Desulfobacteraceae bacterium]|jgi:phospholipid transport system substrate-binding protein